jgi:LuxR family transcriptional regulator, maltose regulon positive regulatory protein
MSIRNLIILSQLSPPAQPSRVLERERLLNRLSPSVHHPLTILEAGTGYGKSTTILSFLAKRKEPIYWYSISGTDRDPRLFLAKLFSAFNQHKDDIGGEAIRILETSEGTYHEAMIAFLNTISSNLTEESFFVLDDYHLVVDVDEITRMMDWMVDHLPPKLHNIIATRLIPKFSNINKWRVKGSVLEINKDELVFSAAEIEELFNDTYGMALNKAVVKDLLDRTEGWAIGLQMVWQTLQGHPEMSIQEVMEGDRYSRTALFDYLAQEVLESLDQEIQAFLLQTSILSKLESETCDFLLNVNHSDQILRSLENKGLFLEELRPGVYRYHHIFRQFLLSRLQTDTERVKLLHRKMASYFQAHEYWEEAIYHLLSAQDYHQINQIMETIGEKFIKGGRQETINYWINEIPQEIRKNYPFLLYLLGEVNRFLGQFEQALEYYHASERLYRKRENQLGISKALRGQGQVYLDTIRPVYADQLLRDALKLLDPNEMPEEVADLLVFIAENQLNLGYPENAQKLLSQAINIRHHLDREIDLIQARIYLRTGRLDHGINLLSEQETSYQSVPPSRPQRFHREGSLLLSLFYAIKGELENCEKYANQGIAIGKLLQSTFVQSVGFMRLGHAILLKSHHPFYDNEYKQAIQYYQESIDKVDVTRIHAEPLWGMCRALGYTYHFSEAERRALEALEIVKKAGDEWMSALIQLTVGAGAVLAKHYEVAHHYLTNAEVTAQKVKDPFVLCITRMWLALGAWNHGFQNTAFGYLEKFLQAIKLHGYSFLLTNETLMGLKDCESIYPLLISAFENNVERDMVENLLQKRGLHRQTYHPGYSLWIQTFGGFRVWRGDQLIHHQDWKREKARHLLQLLVAFRDKWLYRDQITNMLWADTPVEKAANYLKVVLNSLNQVLEPERPRGEDSFFIERDQERYRLNPIAKIIIDADLFTKFIKDGTINALQNAMNIYQGGYFSGNYAQEWLAIDEQHYHQKFLLAAESLIVAMVENADFDRALEITYKILNEDPLWEPAYRLQMTIFSKMDRQSMVKEVFEQCQTLMQEKMGSQISQSTSDLYETLIRKFQ